jgi:hypothetical protein
MKTIQLFYEYWLEVTKQKQYQDKWLSDEMYHRAIKAHYVRVGHVGCVAFTVVAPWCLSRHL